MKRLNVTKGEIRDIGREIRQEMLREGYVQLTIGCRDEKTEWRLGNSGRAGKAKGIGEKAVFVTVS